MHAWPRSLFQQLQSHRCKLRWRMQPVALGAGHAGALQLARRCVSAAAAAATALIAHVVALIALTAHVVA